MLIWFFDIDGTLIQTGGAGRAAMAAAIAADFQVEPDTRDVKFSGRSDLAIVSELFAAHQAPLCDQGLAEFYAGYLRQLSATLDERDGGVLPGVDRWLDKIDSHADSHLGILTGNMREAARMKLAKFNLDERFRFGGYGDEHSDRNDVAKAALADARLNLGNTFQEEAAIWVIGDTPNDIRCARSINAKVIAVATGGHPAEELREHEPDILLDDLSDVEPLDTIFREHDYRSAT